MNELKLIAAAMVKKYERVGNEVYNKNLYGFVSLSITCILAGIDFLICNKASDTELDEYVKTSAEKLKRLIIKNEALLNNPKCEFKNLSF
jgi:hypothetical protein